MSGCAVNVPEPLHITFVCTNNFVRSPMAELMFSDQIRHNRGSSGLVRVTSAGTFDDPRWGTRNVGGGIAPVVADLLERRWGIRTIRHRAQQLNADHLGADLIVAMDHGHVAKLRELGAPAERIRLLRSFDPKFSSGAAAPDVADPEFNHEVQRVYDEIKSALPGLHAWVDAQIAARPATAGWRVCYTVPGQAQLTLYSPCHGARHEGLRLSNCRTNNRIIRATCSIDPDHEPPAFGCTCGIYGVGNGVDALYRVRAMTANIRREDTYNSWFPYHPNRGMAPVLTHVMLQGAVAHDDVGTWCPLSHVRQQIATSTPVIRAASAEIIRIFVTRELIGAEAAVEVAERLATTFGVEAVAGLPTFTRHDWDTRPQWMRTEPWRTKYHVDALIGRPFPDESRVTHAR
ncbi:putative low molecular weight protein-tyrosine-phosphatase [Mycobacterium simulans]|nr:putative low molecular weight protein-tyrosine-phosphatase [Mycobacterium simulans]